MKTYTSTFGIILLGLIITLIICCKKESPKVEPTVTLTTATNITANSTTSGGSVTADGGDQVTARGVCWSSTNATPTTSDNKTTDGTGTGFFSSSLSGLTQGTTYNIRAYATNSVGTGYSSATSFKTLALAPTLTTTDLSAVTATSFNSGGNITNDGGSPVTARGDCWSSNQNPTFSDSKTSDGTGTGIFTSSVTGLAAGTTYYARAYATNSIGTTYGNQLTSKTSAVVPTLTTTVASSITSTTATSGGNITSDGGGAISIRGVCWGTTASPTTTGSKTSDNTGTGSFTSSITGLTANTTYYVRAYATNSAGTAYGSEISFKTSAKLPTLTTTAVTAITNTTASSGGNVTNDGGATISARGVCWSTSQNPTTTDNKTADATGTGVFTSSITGLTANTTYYIRAYASNSAGTAYGNQVSATTTNTPTGLADVYYGKVAVGGSFMPTAEYIKANFNRASGEVGGYPIPKKYQFDTTPGQYIYFVYKDSPSGVGYGYRAINWVRVPGACGSSQIAGYGVGSVYSYKQIDPPTTQILCAGTFFVQYYGKIDIDGTIYRVWKSGLANVDPVVEVFSIPDNPSGLADVYYGISTDTQVTADYILTNFTKTTGPVGTPTGKQYTFGDTFNTYRFWAIPDLPNTGERVIANLTTSDGLAVIGLQPGGTFYTYYQNNPTPPSQSIQYGKLDINGITYRLYRTTLKYTSTTTQFRVYSF